MLTLVQHGDTLNLIEERHLDSLSKDCEYAIKNLELQVKEYDFQVNEYMGQAERYKQISRNDAEIIKTQASQIEQMWADKRRLKFKAGLIGALALVLGIIL